jgi:hypothetical protein
MNKNIRNRIKRIEDNESWLLRMVRKMGREHEAAIINFFATELKPTNGVLVSGFENIRAALNLSKLDQQFVVDRTKLATAMAERLIQHSTGVTSGFATYVQRVQDFENVQEKVLAKTREYIGFRLEGQPSTERGGIIKEGLLNETIVKADYLREVKVKLLNSINRGDITIGQLINDFKGTIAGNTERQGTVESWFRTAAFDTFANVDRMVANDTATDLGLNWGVFSGGIIKTTRQFCRCRNGIVYTREKIASWKDLDFTGKPQNYDPFTDLGGYNCRHVLDWVDENTANAISKQSGRPINSLDCNQ